MISESTAQSITAVAGSVYQIRLQSGTEAFELIRRLKATDSTPAISPVGIRPFEATHSTFYLWLLPDSYAPAHSLPDSVTFWTDQLSSGSRSFRVGCLWGKSGVGKTSFVAAALIPNLPDNVQATQVRATPHGTHTDIDAALRLPLAPGKDRRFIVLDQFEQWLVSNRWPMAEDPLVQQLARSDGHSLAFLLVYRDGVEELASRLFRVLGIDRDRRENYSVLDEFHPGHARLVLSLLGHAFDRVQGDPDAFNRFVDQSVALLTTHEAVSPLRLSVFAEMMKHVLWRPDSLRDLGHDEKIVKRFIERSIEGPLVPYERARLRRQARALLASLLPAQGELTRAEVLRSASELASACDLSESGDDFKLLLRFLDDDLHLISQRVVSSAASLDGPAPPVAYELTHDFLVKAIRLWLYPLSDRSYRAAARRRLESLAATWTSQSFGTFPSPIDYVRFRMLVHRPWNANAERMMRAAARLYRLLVAVVLLALTWFGAVQATTLNKAFRDIAALSSATPSALPHLLKALVAERTPFVAWLVDARLRELQKSADPVASLRGSVALFNAHPGYDATSVANGLLLATPGEALLISRHLLDRGTELPPALLAQLVRRAADSQGTELLHAIVSLASSSTWLASSANADLIDRAEAAILALPPTEADTWLDAMPDLAPLLVAHAVSEYRSGRNRATALHVVIRYADASPAALAGALIAADDLDRATLISVVTQNSGLSAQVKAPLHGFLTGDIDSLSRARGAAALFALDDYSAFLESVADPTKAELVSEAIHLVALSSPDPRILARLLTTPLTPAQTRALLLVSGLASFSRGPELDPGLVWRYIGDDDPGIATAAEWLANKSGIVKGRTEAVALSQGLLGTMTEEEIRARRQYSDGGRWRYFSPTGKAMLAFEGPISALMGSDGTEARFASALEIPKSPVEIDYPFAVGAVEVTVGDMRAFFLDKYGEDTRYRYRVDYSPSDEHPANRVSWFLAMEYCDWLSEKEGIPVEQRMFPPRTRYEPPLDWPAGYMQRTGYRLPTEAEWEFVARGGAGGCRPFAAESAVLTEYAATRQNTDLASMFCVGSLCPNQYGAYDMLGNVLEWCLNPMQTAVTTVKGGAQATQFEAKGQIRWADDHVMRGGSFYNEDSGIRVNYRYQYLPVTFFHNSGFRVARRLPLRSSQAPANNHPETPR